MTESPNVRWFAELGLDDVETVGGKNASLGEMVQHLAKAGVRVPDGFATTAEAYRRFLAHEGLADRINAMLDALDVGRDSNAPVGDYESPFPPAATIERITIDLLDR